MNFLKSQHLGFFDSLGSTLVPGILCSPKVALNADFFVSIIRDQELGCLLRGGVDGVVLGGCVP